MAAAGSSEAPAIPPGKVLNVNIGIMGHVDSGKTSLARALSTTLSTAALDKNPQSQERGITLDLGFSSFVVPMPDHIKEAAAKYEILQFTLVDCPGHASLIKTIIGGAQIIDMMMLVIDVTKGIQTQTAECLVIGEILMDRMVLVLNKVDQLPADTRQEKISKMQQGLNKVFAGTKFKTPIMVPVSATGGNADAPAAENLDGLVDTLKSLVTVPERVKEGPFYFAIDHCFPIKGHGTVMTGTVLSGSVRVNDTVEIPDMKIQKKVKSMQMFKKPVLEAVQGDRVGILVTQLDAKQIERATLATPNSVPSFHAAVLAVEKIRFYKASFPTKRKIHITVGHTTVMATVHFFTLPPSASGASPPAAETSAAASAFDFGREYFSADELLPTSGEVPAGSQWAFVLFERPVTAPANSLLIGSVLDTDVHANKCRIVLSGRVLSTIDPNSKDDMARLKIFKNKQKVGSIKRVLDEQTVIGKDLFKKETDITKFLNLKVTLNGKTPGYIEGSFGSSGQYKVRFHEPHGLPISVGKKGKGKAKDEDADADGPAEGGGGKIILEFKKYLFSTETSNR
eukprot:CAMPEP_0181342210 /NCGR_PEP_ID=MMETSP1101-20121128/30867_1 /TAXON_ID=46948 /ORGANISM="Rhodomonas abbreviata, Strain Caron Lab Isolate" /LENGTH=567 /DNA_ID=CAMNT_0023453629 /DNA_START=171 /DNA_END=1871 /DNA_ORIENTATION=-